jgi:predicted permease
VKILSGFKRLFHLGTFRDDPAGDLDAELSFHFRQTEEELIGQGLNPTDAREEARRRFGNLNRYRRELARIDRQRAAKTRRLAFFESVFQDLAYLARGLRREPGFTAAVVLTLALGIGANATMFGVVDHLLLSPPDHVENPDDVVRLQVYRTWAFVGVPDVYSYMPYADYQDFLAARTLEAVAAFGDQEVILGEGDRAERVNALFTTASFFSLLGVQPALGRFFLESEENPAGPAVAVLSHGLWQRRFGGRRDILGQSLAVGNETYTVIGVVPRGFNGVDLEPVDLFLPIHAFTAVDGSDEWVSHRGWYWLQTLARLSPSSSREAAAEEATALHRNGRRELLEEGRYSEDARVVLGSVNAALGPDAPEEVQVSRWLVGVTLIVLLIACANVANLLLARGARRRRELGIRVALGIPRRRLVRQLFLESIALAGLGGIVGLGLAYWGGQAVRGAFLPQVAWPPSPVDKHVLLFTLGTALATGLLAGMAPAWTRVRGGLADALKDGERGGTARRSRSQTALLVIQAALSVILLVGAGLFVKSLTRAKAMDLGLDPEGLIVASLELDGEWDAPALLDLANRAAGRIEATPGVQHASVTSRPPFAGMSAFNLFVPGMDSIPAPRGITPLVTSVSSDYLSTLGIQLKRGRVFTEQEVAAGARVAVVTENMAEGIWTEESALGQCLMISERESPCWEIVGVVESSRLTDLDGQIPWQYYLPLGDPTFALGARPGAILIRGDGNGSQLLAPIRRQLQALDPSVRFVNVALLQDDIDPHLRPWRLGATMFTLFGSLALIVAAMGLYSVLAFNVARRTQELGVRSAMGASRTRLVNMVLRQSVTVTAMGVFLGLSAALILAAKMGPLLFGTSPRDLQVMLGVVAVLLAVALAAGAIPAWAAARVDPMRALRTD